MYHNAWNCVAICVIVLLYPTQISNILDPTDEDTAISPSPFRATMTEVIKSGIEVPAARNVKPITLKVCLIRTKKTRMEDNF